VSTTLFLSNQKHLEVIQVLVEVLVEVEVVEVEVVEAVAAAMPQVVEMVEELQMPEAVAEEETLLKV
jgi:hypothetical protein